MNVLVVPWTSSTPLWASLFLCSLISLSGDFVARFRRIWKRANCAAIKADKSSIASAADRSESFPRSFSTLASRRKEIRPPSARFETSNDRLKLPYWKRDWTPYFRFLSSKGKKKKKEKKTRSLKGFLYPNRSLRFPYDSSLALPPRVSGKLSLPFCFFLPFPSLSLSSRHPAFISPFPSRASRFIRFSSTKISILFGRGIDTSSSSSRYSLQSAPLRSVSLPIPVSTPSGRETFANSCECKREERSIYISSGQNESSTGSKEIPRCFRRKFAERTTLRRFAAPFLYFPLLFDRYQNRSGCRKS